MVILEVDRSILVKIIELCVVFSMPGQKKFIELSRWGEPLNILRGIIQLSWIAITNCLKQMRSMKRRFDLVVELQTCWTSLITLPFAQPNFVYFTIACILTELEVILIDWFKITMFAFTTRSLISRSGPQLRHGLRRGIAINLQRELRRNRHFVMMGGVTLLGAGGLLFCLEERKLLAESVKVS